MTHKLELYYVVKVTEGRNPVVGNMVKDAEYMSGPFGNYSDALNSKSNLYNEGYFLNSHFTIATQYIDVEI